MIGLNIWNKGQLRLFCILIGMMVGYVAAVAAGLLTLDDFMSVLRQPLIAFPSVAHVSFAFDPSLIIPFAVSALAAAMGSTAVITTYQRTTDADWVRPDMISIRRGIFLGGIAASTAGLLGTYGLSLASANVGLVVATGVASRRIALIVAAILAIASGPARLRGGADDHAAASDGVRSAVHGRIHHDQRRPDHLVARAGLAPHAGDRHGHDDVFHQSPFFRWRFPVSALGAAGRGSPLVLATLVALALNLVFRLGIRRKVTMSVDPAKPVYEEVANFVERNAAIWGARRDVVTRVAVCRTQGAEAIVEHCRPNGPIAVEIGYDEFDIDVTLTYRGKLLELTGQLPTQQRS